MAVAHKGSISMRLVLIPVGLYKTTVDNDIHFNELDKASNFYTLIVTQYPNDFPYIAPYLTIKIFLLPTFWYKHDMILALPSSM